MGGMGGGNPPNNQNLQAQPPPIFILYALTEASAEASSHRVQPPCVKTDDFFLCDFNQATKPAAHLRIIFSSLHTLTISFFSPLSCFQTIPVVSQPRLTSHADGNAILLTCAPSLLLLLHLLLSQWVCGIVSQLSTKQTSFLLFLYNPHSASWA